MNGLFGATLKNVLVKEYLRAGVGRVSTRVPASSSVWELLGGVPVDLSIQIGIHMFHYVKIGLMEPIETHVVMSGLRHHGDIHRYVAVTVEQTSSMRSRCLIFLEKPYASERIQNRVYVTGLLQQHLLVEVSVPVIASLLAVI